MSKQLACLDLLTFDNFDSGPCRQIVDIKYFAICIFYDNLWMLVTFMLDYNRSADLAFPLFFNSNRLTFDDIYKACLLYTSPSPRDRS